MTEYAYWALLCVAALLPAAMGCMPPHRGKILHLGLAGVMVMGGWAGAQAARLPLPEVWTAVCAVCIAGAAGAVWALTAGAAAMRAAADAEISGTVLNLLFALPALLMGGKADGEDGLARMLRVEWMDRAWSLFIPLSFLLAGLTLLLLYRTKGGVAMRAAGENPGVAAEAGLGACGPRIKALLLTGALGGISGLAWRLHGPDGSALQTGGLALLVLAALCFGRYRAWRVLVAAVLLALLRALAAAADSMEVLQRLNCPREIWQMLPYGTALLLCLIGKRRGGEGRTWLGYRFQSQGRNML